MRYVIYIAFRLPAETLPSLPSLHLHALRRRNLRPQPRQLLAPPSLRSPLLVDNICLSFSFSLCASLSFFCFCSSFSANGFFRLLVLVLQQPSLVVLLLILLVLRQHLLAHLLHARSSMLVLLLKPALTLLSLAGWHALLYRR